MITFQLLGPLIVRRDGAQVAVGGPRRRSTLIRLLLADGRVLPVETLIDDVWGDATPPTARNTLQGYVSGMRKALGADAPIVLDNIGYRIQVPEEAVDLRCFERLVNEARGAIGSDPARALRLLDDGAALWHGPPLADVADEEWARGAITRLEELDVVAGELRAEANAALGRDSEATALLEGLIAANPYREHLTALLARALYRTGRQTDALRAIDRTADRLRDELGLSLGPELLELQGAILRHDAQLAAVPLVDVSASPPARPAAAAPPPPPLLPSVIARRRDRVSLVARSHELAALHDAWAVAESSGRLVAVVEGEAGTGKTRLAVELARAAGEQGACVLWGRSRTEGEAPYATLADAADARLSVLDAAARDELLTRHPVLARLVPELTGHSIVASPLAPDVGAEQRLLIDALEAIGGGPDTSTLLVLDDLQWIDESSLALVERLVDRAPPTARLLVVATRRTIPMCHCPHVDWWLVQLQRDGILRRVQVAPFTPPEVEAFIAAADASGTLSGDADEVHRITSGNAFFVEELLRHAALSGGSLEELPRTVQEAIGARLASLQPAAQRLVEFGAALDDEFAASTLAECVDRPVPEIVEPLDEAIRAGLLRDTPDAHIGFAHALARAAVLSTLTPVRRAGLHLRIADVFESSGRSRHDYAHHVECAGALVPPDRRWAALAARAAEYLAHGAPDAALDDAERLLHEVDPQHAVHLEALYLRGAARGMLGDGPGARESFKPVVEICERHGDRQLLYRAVSGLVNAKSGLGLNFGAPDPYLTDLLERLLADPSLPADRRAQLMTGRLIARSTDADPEELRVMADEVLAFAERLGTDDEVAVARAGWRIALWTPENLDRRSEMIRSAVAPAEARGRIDLQLAVDTLLIADMFEAGQPIDDALATMRRRLERMPLTCYVAWSRFIEAASRLVHGDPEHARELADEGLAAGRDVLAFDAEVAWYGIHVMAGRDDGKLDERLCQPPVPAYKVNLVAPRLLAALASTELGRDEPADVVLGELVTTDGVALRPDPFSLAGIALLAEMAVLRNDAARACVLAEALRPYAGRLGLLAIGASTGPVSRSIGIALATAGDLDGALAHLDAAIEQCRALPAPIWLDRCLRERSAVAEQGG